MILRFFWFSIIAIAIWVSGPRPARAFLFVDDVDSEITLIHDGPTTRENVLVHLNGVFGDSVNSNQLSSTALIDSSLEFKHEYRYGEPNSDFPGFIRIESNFDADQLIVRVIPNLNPAFASTQIKLAFSDLKFPDPGTLAEEVISDVQLISSSSTAVSSNNPFAITADFSPHGITIDLQSVRLIGGTTTAVFGITTSRVPEPATILLASLAGVVFCCRRRRV